MQAVPSGSGRLSVGNLQEVQPIGGSHASGKALITAALAKMGLTSRHSAKASFEKSINVVPKLYSTVDL